MKHWYQGTQWGDERRLTLADMMVRLRMALSEPHSGTWGTVVYDIDQDFDASATDFDLTPEPDKYVVNELALMLNDAVIYTVTDLYERGYAFPEVEYRVPVMQGMKSVVLPGDFMAMESVFHFCGPDRSQVEESSIKELEDMYPHGYTYSSDKFFTYYEVRGNMGLEIVSGQLLPENVLDYDDALQLPAEDARISVGDFVVNETDGSSARITDINGQILELSELVGGRTNTFESLDFYSVQSAAQPFERLHLWPELERVSESKVYEGVASGWVLNEWVSPTRLSFLLDEIPPSINPRKARVYVSIHYDTTPDANSPTFRRIAGGGLFEALQKGWNEVMLLTEEDFEPNTQYYVSVMTNDYDASAETGTLFDVSRIEVSESSSDNFLKNTYTRLPLPMLKPETMCELPPYLVNAAIECAKVFAYQKKSGQPQFDPGMLSGYEMWVGKGLRFLRKRGPSGNANVFRNPHGMRSNRRFYGFSIPKGFTNRVYF